MPSPVSQPLSQPLGQSQPISARPVGQSASYTSGGNNARARDKDSRQDQRKDQGIIIIAKMIHIHVVLLGSLVAWQLGSLAHICKGMKQGRIHTRKRGRMVVCRVLGIGFMESFPGLRCIFAIPLLLPLPSPRSQFGLMPRHMKDNNRRPHTLSKVVYKKCVVDPPFCME